METKKQKIAIVAIVVLMVVGIIGTTIAYFTGETLFKNEFKTPAHESEFTEEFTSPDNWLPGDEEKKEVSVTNTGEYDIAVRISYTEEWIGADGVTQLPLVQDQDGTDVIAAIINFPNKDDWGKKIGEDGVTYYYYKDILGTGESTSLFMDKVTFNKDIIHDENCTNIYTYSDDTTSSGNASEEGKTVKSTTKRCESTGQTYAGGTYILTIKIETIQADQYKNGWGLEEDLEDLEWEKTIESVMKKNAVIDNIASTYVTAETGINFFEKGGTDWNNPDGTYSNGNGIYLRAGTENNEYPIYYYRGEVDNNLLFAGFCWLIVRTTETGGTKIVYNGIPTGENKNQCGAGTYSGSVIGYTEWSDHSFGPENYAGYMYDGGTSSNIKIFIDNWYEENILNKYDRYLEDTIWCNDMTIARTESNRGANIITFGTYVRLWEQGNPIVTCPQDSDKYTVKETSPMYNANLNGNKLLDYPIALLTADEIALSGAMATDSLHENYSYLHLIGYASEFYSMTPHSANTGTGPYVKLFSYFKSGNMTYGNIKGGSVRPAISLKNGLLITEGDGTTTNPYIIEY